MKKEPDDHLKRLYQKMYEMTRAKCMSFCPGFCCESHYCCAIRDDLSEMGVEFKETDHPTMCFMGPDGCILEPWQRPLCTVHICEYHLIRDKDFYQDYMKLRQELSDLEFKRMGYGSCEYVTPFYGL